MLPSGCHHIGRDEPPTREPDIGFRSRATHEEARRVLLKRNLRRVVSAAKRYGGPQLSIEGLSQEDGIGQVKAVEKFDPDERCRFCPPVLPGG